MIPNNIQVTVLDASTLLLASNSLRTRQQDWERFIVLDISIHQVQLFLSKKYSGSEYHRRITALNNLLNNSINIEQFSSIRKSILNAHDKINRFAISGGFISRFEDEILGAFAMTHKMSVYCPKNGFLHQLSMSQNTLFQNGSPLLVRTY